LGYRITHNKIELELFRIRYLVVDITRGMPMRMTTLQDNDE